MSKHTEKWISLSDQLPPDKQVVETKIDDSKGVRNEQKLMRSGKLFFTDDGEMYVYYTPTHWRYI